MVIAGIWRVIGSPSNTIVRKRISVTVTKPQERGVAAQSAVAATLAPLPSTDHPVTTSLFDKLGPTTPDYSYRNSSLLASHGPAELHPVRQPRLPVHE
jgi:hypothetical protein